MPQKLTTTFKPWPTLTIAIAAIIILSLACSGSGSAPATPAPGIETQVFLTLAAGNPPTAPPPPNAPPTATLTPIPSPTWTNTPPPTEPIAQATGPASCIPPGAPEYYGMVTKIIDGDTIDVDLAGQIQRVRYIGIDTPEATTSVEYFGAQATEHNAQLVANQLVKLIKDVSETDQYGRLLRYVFVGELFVNYELVRQGYANAATYPPDVACAETFRQAEEQARLELIGLWLPTPAPTDTRKPIPPTATKAASSGNCSPSYPTVCIPPPPPDLDCPDIPYKNFKVLPPDPHNFDGNHDGVGCEK